MPDLLVFGSAASVPDGQHDTLALALRGPGWAALVDCGGSPLHKLARAGVAHQELRALFLTHHHADHLYGLPVLVQGLWLGGREADLPIYGPEQALERAHALLSLFGLAQRQEMFRLAWHPVALRPGQPVTTLEGLRVSASPTVHSGVEAVALRFETASGQAAVYSSDTEPCPAVAELAAGAHLLLHEATGDFPGHSTPEGAAEVAREAGVERLGLIHYPVHDVDLARWRDRASGWGGETFLARDGDVYAF